MKKTTETTQEQKVETVTKKVVVEQDYMSQEFLRDMNLHLEALKHPAISEESEELKSMYVWKLLEKSKLDDSIYIGDFLVVISALIRIPTPGLVVKAMYNLLNHYNNNQKFFNHLVWAYMPKAAAVKVAVTNNDKKNKCAITSNFGATPARVMSVLENGNVNDVRKNYELTIIKGNSVQNFKKDLYPTDSNLLFTAEGTETFLSVEALQALELVTLMGVDKGQNKKLKNLYMTLQKKNTRTASFTIEQSILAQLKKEKK